MWHNLINDRVTGRLSTLRDMVGSELGHLLMNKATFSLKKQFSGFTDFRLSALWITEMKLN